MGDLRFTQCVAILFDRAPAMPLVERALSDWPLAGAQQPAPGEGGWLACGPGLAVELRSGGSVLVDLADRPWPDEPRHAPAWSAGWFGPSAVPGALARARAQCWSWGGGAEAAARHGAFLRLRTVVELAAGGTQLPSGHDPAYELTALTELAAPLLRLPGASALFFPGGEALRSLAQVEAALAPKSGMGKAPLELWVNLRAVGLGEAGGVRWMAADTVGMGQLRLPDQEALFAEGEEDPEAVAQLLLGACHRLVAGRGLEEAARDARGRRWAAAAAAGCLPPARPVTRWTPQQGPLPPRELLDRLGPPAQRPR